MSNTIMLQLNTHIIKMLIYLNLINYIYIFFAHLYPIATKMLQKCTIRDDSKFSPWKALGARLAIKVHTLLDWYIHKAETACVDRSVISIAILV